MTDIKPPHIENGISFYLACLLSIAPVMLLSRGDAPYSRPEGEEALMFAWAVPIALAWYAHFKRVKKLRWDAAIALFGFYSAGVLFAAEANRMDYQTAGYILFCSTLAAIFGLVYSGLWEPKAH